MMFKVETDQWSLEEKSREERSKTQQWAQRKPDRHMHPLKAAIPLIMKLFGLVKMDVAFE